MDIDLAFDFKYQEACLLLQLHPKYILRFFTEPSQVMKKIFFPSLLQNTLCSF